MLFSEDTSAKLHNMDLNSSADRFRDDIILSSHYDADCGASPAPVPRSLDLSGLMPLVESATLALGTCAAQAAEMPESTAWHELLLCRETALAARANRLDVTVSDILIERFCSPCPTQVRCWLRLPMNFRRAIGIAMADARSHRRDAFRTTAILGLHRHCADGLVDLAPADSFRTRESRTRGVPRPAPPRFIPPPPGRITACMDDLIDFLARPGRGTEAIPLVVRMAVAASQIMAIQPFSLTGTDLMQRILVPMMAAAEGLPPVLIGGAMRDHGRNYAQSQIEPHVSGDWSAWIAMFLAGYVEAIHETRVFMAGLRALTASWARAVAGLRSDSAVHRIVASLASHPVLLIPSLQRSLGLSYQRANCAVALLVDKGIVSLASDTRRNRVFIAHDLTALLERRGAGGGSG
jgi:Fic family protein